MRVGPSFILLVGMLVLAGCGDEGSAAKTDEGSAASTQSGLTGQVHLGPQCPVEVAGEPCEDRPAANVTVSVSEQIPGVSSAAGEVVERGTTDADGTYRIAVAPGRYVVTADAGKSCERMDARVAPGAYAEVDIPCDTGIR